jgi:ribosomal protein S18 acetylase RimI-like enzyme
MEYIEQARDFELRLDVGSVDLQRFAGHTDRAASAGIAITTLAEELRRDPACLPGVFQAYCVLDVSAPREDPELPKPEPGTLGEFTTRLVEGRRALPDALFLAKFGELYVGLCMLMRSEGDPSLLYQELTGVLPAFQGLGIATALKLRTVDYAQRRGARRFAP